MKKNLYKIIFNLQYSCGGVNSLATDCHTTVAAYTQEDAVALFKNNLMIGNQNITGGYTITKVKLIELT